MCGRAASRSTRERGSDREPSMPVEEFEPLDAIEARRWLRHQRYAELVRGGYESSDAFVLSTDFAIGVREAIALLACGYPSATALRILVLNALRTAPPDG